LANGVDFNTRTGDNNIDGILIGTRWSTTSLTYAFPTSSAYFPTPYDAGENEFDNSYVTGFSAANAAWQTAFGKMLQNYANVSNLSFTFVSSTTQADIVLAMTTTASVPTADARFPTYTNEGHQWYNPGNYDVTPVIGSYTWATLLHETGHTMGLAHGHSPDTITGVPAVVMNADRDSIEFSIMTYRGYIGANPAGGYTNEDYGFAQTLMMYDIAAIQLLYGADFAYNAGNNVYTFSATTGEMFVDGVGQGTPGANRVFRTVWDGNGVDTFDLSNYTTALNVNLTPGGWSTFSAVQIANLGDGNFARGNVFNALLHNNDTRSLIENVRGGSGNDQIVGNRGSNTLEGRLGNDTLVGAGGSDILLGNEGNDILWGDQSNSVAGIGFGSGLYVHGSSHDSIAAAYNLTSTFSLANNPNISNSTSVAHTTMRYTSAAGDSAQYYRLNLASGQTITLDIDTTTNLDSFIKLLRADGTQLASNDDGLVYDPGSVASGDSDLVFTVTTAGTYYFVVGQYSSNTTLPGSAGYDLHVSVTDSVLGTDGVGGADSLYGLAGTDTLVGGAGADNLYGGAGADGHYGGDGVDFARYDDANYGNLSIRLDVPSINAGAAAGDTYFGIEGLVGGVGNDTVVGNSLANYLYGAGGNDNIYGQGGVDYLNGGAGTNNLWGGSGADQHIGGTGFDYARYDDANWGNLIIRLDTPAANVGAVAVGDTYTGIEGLVGGVGSDVVIGNASANYLFGGGGADYINALAGNDYMNGGAGADRFVFTSALNATTNIDTVADFAHAVDDIALSQAIFAGIGATLDASEFQIGMANAATDRIIYNNVTGQLFYDSNGNGAGGMTQFATVTAGTVLDTGDFVMV
jgi:serralysin